MFLRRICQAIARCRATTYHPAYCPPRYRGRSFLPQVTLEFTEAFVRDKNIQYDDGQEKALGDLWDELLKRNPRIRLRPLYRGATGKAREGFEKFIHWVESRQPGVYKAPNFFAYFQIVGPSGTDFAGIAKRLRAEDRIFRRVNVLRPAGHPAVDTTNQPRYPNQHHLAPAPPVAAPGGIDAQAAWLRPGGDGAGVKFVDVERGWLLEHEDLPPTLNATSGGPSLIHGVNDPWFQDHGTPVLGIICAMDHTHGGNSVGGVGIAPRAEGYVSSWFEGYDDEWSELTDHAEAIRVATTHLTNLRFPNLPQGPSPPVGDVLLLEAQLEDPDDWAMNWPLDTDFAIADTIGLATAAGISVVEAGGNGDEAAHYFDTDAGTPPLFESGAILVSCAQIVQQRIVPMSYAPRGGRVDCFAWGFGINTSWADGGGETGLYVPTDGVPGFNGTSAAAAIVAGAAIVLQGIARQTAFGALTPAQMRAALSNPEWNTSPDAASPPHAIGCMPDLARLIAALDGGALHAPLPP